MIHFFISGQSDINGIRWDDLALQLGVSDISVKGDGAPIQQLLDFIGNFKELKALSPILLEYKLATC